MPRRPLLLTGDPLLLDELLRLAAAAGVETEVAHDAVAARGSWAESSLVLLGADRLEQAIRAGLPRRSNLLVVTGGVDVAALWPRVPALGAEGVVPLPDAESMLIERLSLTAPGATPAGSMVVVLGGRGGAGASTLACALARTAAQESPVLLVDGDPLGGGLDLVLGAEGLPGLRWPDLAGVRGSAGARDLRAVLPCVDGVAVLSWHRGTPVPLAPEAMKSVLGAARAGHRVVVVDLPRRLDPAAEVAATAADLALLVVPAEVRAVAAAAALAGHLAGVVRDLRVVVRGPAPAGLTADLVARELALPLAGWLPPEPGLAAALERGVPPGRSGRGPLARLCADLVTRLPSSRVESAA